MTKARVNADNASADIQGVTAGTGLSGGGTSGTVTLTNDMATAIDAKGDIVVGTGADTYDNLAVGANDTILTADSSTATGLKWAAPAASGATLGANTFTADQNINGITLGRGAGNISTNATFGSGALAANTTGTNTIALGRNALAGQTTGGTNVAVGFNALQVANSDLNTAVGVQSQQQTSTGAYNTSIGWQSLTLNTTGDFNTAIGSGASNAKGVTGSNNTTIGYLAAPTNDSVSNTITLGNSSIATLRCQVTSITALSDARDKKNIEPLNVGLNFINELKPVTFDWNMRPTMDKDGNVLPTGKIDVPDTGFIAQDFIIAEDAVGLADHLQLTSRENPDALEITQGRLIPILVKAIQDLSAKVSELEAKANL